MSVIIRLQNLPWSANALDIRQYFRGLSIPEGGVHIVGGELGDAFIAFSTDEDARQAFQLNGGKIKEVQIKLLLSSRTEMQKVIEAARNPAPFLQVAPPQPLTLPPQTSSIDANSVTKTDGFKSDSEKSNDRKARRSKSPRDRRRDRSRDRSRERKDRRRRSDRSRSRDRHDRHRRSRSRNRSRTRDRSRSRDRELGARRGARDKKKSTSVEKTNGINEFSSTSTTNTDLTDVSSTFNLLNNPASPWETNLLLNNINLLPRINPSPNLTINMADRRPLGLINSKPNITDIPKLMATNTYRTEDNSWQSATSSNFPDRNINNVNSNNNPQIEPFRNDAFRNRNNRNNFNQGVLDNRNMTNNPINARPLFGRSVGGSFSSMDSNDKMQHREVRPKVPRPGCCVKMQMGRAGYGDVRRFFNGLFIANDGIKLINDEYGQRTGVAYIRFVRPEGKVEALKRTGTATIRGETVEIVSVDDDEFENAVDSFLPGRNERNFDRSAIYGENIIDKQTEINSNLTCISISHLPPYTKEHDIITMMEDFPVLSILMVMTIDSQQRGYIQFTKAEDAHRFAQLRNRHRINNKKVTIELVSESVFYEVKRQHNTGNGKIELPEEKVLNSLDKSKRSNYSPDVEFISDCVILKGLPNDTTDHDILDFFSDVGLIPTRIHVPFGKSKHHESFCEFSSTNEALQAVKKSGMPLGLNEVTVELVARHEMEMLIGKQKDSGNRFNQNQTVNSGNGGGNTFNSGNPRRPLLGNPQQPPRSMNNGNGNAEGLAAGTQYVPEAFHKPGCVVSLENVPFRAGVDEILDFFSDYNIPEENVMRRFNDRGNPTGDARVAFNSPLEAQRAFSELRHCKIRDRTIFMHLQ